MDNKKATNDQPQVNANASNDFKKGLCVGAGATGVLALGGILLLIFRLVKLLKKNKEYQTEIVKLKLDNEDLINMASERLYTQQFENENQSPS